VLGAAGPIRRALAEHLESHDVSRVIYGSVIGLALVVALDAHPPSAGQAAATILGGALAVGLAEMYSEVVGEEARTREPTRIGRIRSAALGAVAVAFGAGFPALFVVLAAFGAGDVHLAFTLAKWTGAALICAYGYVAGRLSGSTIGGSIVHAAAVGAIGVALIGLKALVH
jgi:hypothetical protein